METNFFIAIVITLSVTCVVACFFRNENIYIRTMMMIVTIIATGVWFTPASWIECLLITMALICFAGWSLFHDAIKTPKDSILNKKSLKEKGNKPGEDKTNHSSGRATIVGPDYISWGDVWP